MVGRGTDSTDTSESALLNESGMDSYDSQRINGEYFRVSQGGNGVNESGLKGVEGIRHRTKCDHLKESPGAVSDGPLKDSGDNGESFLHVLYEGASVPMDTEVPMNSKPPWLDEKLLLKGWEFTTKYLFGVVFTQAPALAMILSVQSGLEPLIFTGKSDTPFKAFRRYLSTVSRIVSWYETDVFDKESEGYKNMAAVRILHASIFKKMNEASEEELRSKTTIAGRGTGVWCTYLETLKKDFRGMEVNEPSCPFASLSSLSTEHGEVLYGNQLDLVLVQFAFVSLNILYPEQFGIHGASDEHLEGYCHLWRCLGYLLGIKDRYNICSEDGLEATRERCRAVMEKWVKPGFRDVSPDWEHMYRCLLEGLNHYGVGNTFGGTMALLLWVLNIPANNLRSIMTWGETAWFYLHRFLLGYLMRIPGVLQFHNYLFRRYLKGAKNVSPKWLQQKKDIVYDYERLSSSNN